MSHSRLILPPLICFRKNIDWEKNLLLSSYCRIEAEKSHSKCWHSLGSLLHQKSWISLVIFFHKPMSFWYSSPRWTTFWCSNWTSLSSAPSKEAVSWSCLVSSQGISTGSSAMVWLADVLGEGWFSTDWRLNPYCQRFCVFFNCLSSLSSSSCRFFRFSEPLRCFFFTSSFDILFLI